ncbi:MULTISPECIES: hypothetical protein [unclassified Lysinibacillus]|uniref:hypothetical protein n=1 Tax=unclassified Lysinibacillus TaxID=2636778 RepID=UPI0020112984|nr:MULTISPECIES: hypothetical protein [unclassified Lysinibacillus]MCL1697071.1 hypothetical protein [Lysinibacillus sp. BPa_S21]MCL1702000.1 hypothetical protein [Lysinibacillus sp. Bpr_S20]
MTSFNDENMTKVKKDVEVNLDTFPVPTPNEKRIEETIQFIGTLLDKEDQVKQPSLLKKLRVEWTVTNRLVISLQFLILLFGLWMGIQASIEMTIQVIFLLSPLSIVVCLTECFKTKTFGMNELEWTFKYGTGQLFIVRLLIALGLHFIAVAPIVFVSGFLSIKHLVTLLIVWLIPAMLVAIFLLIISLYTPIHWNNVYIIGPFWLLLSILLIVQQNLLRLWIEMDITIHLCVFVFLLTIMMKVIWKYKEASSLE